MNLLAALDGVEPSPTLLESDVRDRHTEGLSKIKTHLFASSPSH